MEEETSTKSNQAKAILEMDEEKMLYWYDFVADENLRLQKADFVDEETEMYAEDYQRDGHDDTAWYTRYKLILPRLKIP